MFQKLGVLVANHWKSLLAGWILLVVGLSQIAPQWDTVIQDGEFAFLPEDEQSRVGEDLYKQAFSESLLASNIVIVVRRESNEQGLQPEDFDFVDKILKPRIEAIGGIASDDEEAETASAEETAGADSAADPMEAEAGPDDAEAANREKPKTIISKVRTYSDKGIGNLLISKDKKATLVFVALTTEFLDRANFEPIKKIEDLIAKDGELRQAKLIPAGLDLALSGIATVGRDMSVAEAQSASATETWTILLVVILLIAIYRAPVLAFIPLVTVFIAVEFSLKVLALLAQAGIIGLFSGIEVYVTVVLYGAGVDYCMFLVARYKEELDAGATFEEAVQNAVEKVGHALVASGSTTMIGIGMMMFAEFGKFQEAGFAMAFSLLFVLVAAMTFTPALLMMFGKWAFWPQTRSEQVGSSIGWISPTSLLARLMEKDLMHSAWEYVCRALHARPGTILLASIALMTPFAVLAVMWRENLTYGLLSELPQDEASVVGARAVQQHFPAGMAGPVRVLVRNDNVDFTTPDGKAHIQHLSQNLAKRKDELGVSNVMSLAYPLGLDQEEPASRIEKRVFNQRARENYVSDLGDLKGHVTSVDVVFNEDPFARNSIENYEHLRATIKDSLPEGLKESDGTTLHYIGATPSIRDLKAVTGRDQVRIDLLVVVVVFLILIALLRKPAIAAYLIVSVLYSYLVTLGVTFVAFYAMDPVGFPGLDWKVPMFLFTILIAVGEDYNIYLITRIEEEQREHGLVKGVTVALLKTGSIISSCGIIMAGTFCSLMAGTLVGMAQLGFALAFGVLLDTFVVRPILVPAYLIMLHSGRFGWLGRYLGAREYLPPPPPHAHVAAPPVKVGQE